MTHRSNVLALCLLAMAALFTFGCPKDSATTDSVSADEGKAVDTVKADEAKAPEADAAAEADADAAAPADEAKAPEADAAPEAAADDSQDGVADTTGGAPMVAAADKVGGGDITFENAVMGNILFSHKFHVTDKGNACDACHPSVFQMKKGADTITMNDIYAGKFCGKCHNDKGPGFDPKPNCTKCHKK